MEKIKNLVRKHSVISFDIFDTLLLRPYMNPTDLFEHIEKVTGSIGFAEARKQAESVFYSIHGTSKEANLDDIYSTIPEFRALKNKELEYEFVGLICNSEIKKIYDFALETNKTIILSSDMYLPVNFIKQVLKKNGFTKYKKLYVSNQLNRRKDRGDLYDYIIDNLDVPAKQILHIGDNEHSDYKMAQAHGIHSFLYVTRKDSFLKKNLHYRNLAKETTKTLATSIFTALASQYFATGNYWQDFGYLYAGPIVYSYVKFIYDHAKKEDLECILFVARDGYIAQKAFDLINKANIKTHYVYAPRILNYTTNLDYDPQLPEQPRIICQYYHKDIKTTAPQTFIEEHINEFKQLALKEKIKTGYSKYIKNICNGYTKIGVVDTISGQLSAQKLIGKESQVDTIGFYIATLPGRNILSQLLHYDFFTGTARDHFISDNKPDLIELIFSAPEDPIITLKNGYPIYQQNLPLEERQRHQIIQYIEKGVLSFVQDVDTRTAGQNIFVSNTSILSLIKSYVENPTQKDIKNMYAVKKSPYADNSVYIPLFSAPYPFWQVGKTKQLIWRTKLQQLFLDLDSLIQFESRGLKSIKIHLFPHYTKLSFCVSILRRYKFILGHNNKPHN